MRVAMVQFAAGLDKAANVEVLDGLLRAAGRSRPDLVVCPEASMSDFGPPDRVLTDVAEPVDGGFVQALAASARGIGATVIAGMFESPESAEGDGRVYNTLVCIGPDGALLATYRKLHLYDAFGYAESDRLLPGTNEPVTIEVEGRRVGLFTCYDLRFPELARVLASGGDGGATSGADVLAVPAAWLAGPLKEVHWETLLRARAIENTCYVAAAAQSGRSYCGRSMLVDPMGVQVAALGEQVGSCVGEVDADRIAEVRRVNPTLQHRRFHIVQSCRSAGT